MVGVGPIAALSFKVSVDDPLRFARSRTVRLVAPAVALAALLTSAAATRAGLAARLDG